MSPGAHAASLPTVLDLGGVVSSECRLHDEIVYVTVFANGTSLIVALCRNENGLFLTMTKGTTRLHVPLVCLQSLDTALCFLEQDFRRHVRELGTHGPYITEDVYLEGSCIATYQFKIRHRKY